MSETRLEVAQQHTPSTQCSAKGWCSHWDGLAAYNILVYFYYFFVMYFFIF